MNSQSEVISAARNSGGSFGYGGFSIGASDAKQTSSGKYSIKDSKYCRATAEELDSITSISAKKQVADIALKEWGKCIENTQANKLFVMYKPLPDGTGLTGTIIRTVNSGTLDASITGFSSNDDAVTCKIGPETVKSGQAVNIKFIKTQTNFSCKKDRNKYVRIALDTDQDDKDWMELPSIEQQKKTEFDSLNDALNVLKGRINQITFQSDRFNIKANKTRSLTDASICPSGANSNRGEMNGRIEFKQPFSTIPTVMVALSQLDISGSVSGSASSDSNIRINIVATSVDKNGFNYAFFTWCTTNVFGATASWIAVAN